MIETIVLLIRGLYEKGQDETYHHACQYKLGKLLPHVDVMHQLSLDWSPEIDQREFAAGLLRLEESRKGEDVPPFITH